MKEGIRILAIGAVLIFLGLGTAQASNYWTFEVGAFSPGESAFDTGYTFQGSLGASLTSFVPALAGQHAVWNKIWLEAGVGWGHADYKNRVTVYNVGGLTGSNVVVVDGSVDVLPLTVTALIRQPLNNNWEAYGGFGFGVYYVWLDANGIDDSSFETGVHLVGGVAYKVNRNFHLTGEVQYGKVGEDAAGGTKLFLGVRKFF